MFQYERLQDAKQNTVQEKCRLSLQKIEVGFPRSGRITRRPQPQKPHLGQPENRQTSGNWQPDIRDREPSAQTNPIGYSLTIVLMRP